MHCIELSDWCFFGFRYLVCTRTCASASCSSVSNNHSVISNYLLNHWRHATIVNNPLPLISKVVYFTMRKKFAKQKMLHVHVEQQGWLSKLNIAKRVYIGLFSSEQVEDVKTFFRVILVITTLVIACSSIYIYLMFDIYLKLDFKNWSYTL